MRPVFMMFFLITALVVVPPYSVQSEEVSDSCVELPLDGKSVVRQVGTRGSRLKYTSLGVLGKLTRLRLELARLVAAEDGFQQGAKPVHQIVLDARLSLPEGSPVHNYRGEAHIAFYERDQLIATMHAEARIEEGSIRKHGFRAANLVRDIVEFPEAKFEGITRVEICYYEVLPPLNETPRNPITPTDRDQFSKAMFEY